MIPFPRSSVAAFRGSLGAIPVKGIGPGCLVAAADIDFTLYGLVAINNGAMYSGVCLDYTNSAGTANKIDSIRSVVIDNTTGGASNAPVYVVCDDTGDTVVCPANSRCVFRISTNTTRLYAYQISTGLGLARVIACNYDIPGEFSTAEYVTSPIGGASVRLYTIQGVFTATGTINASGPTNVFLEYILIEFPLVSVGAVATVKNIDLGTILWSGELYNEMSIRIDLNVFFKNTGAPSLFDLEVAFPGGALPPESMVWGRVTFYGQGY